jgi:hypothetical protein
VNVGDGTVRRAQEIAFDLDMLSAQIEVFNLVADLKKQVGGGASAPVTDAPFKLAPKLDLKPKKKTVVAAKEAKVQTVVAAPAPIEMPKEAAVVAEGGRAPMGGGDKKDGAVVKPTPHGPAEGRVQARTGPRHHRRPPGRGRRRRGLVVVDLGGRRGGRGGRRGRR